ncbi:MAG: UDP-N-acetylmuramate--L-alanine ligase [Flavobacteriales bacterium]
MKPLATYRQIYFIGIGGIGMSALARYFHFAGYKVAGYDKVESALTQTLCQEGIAVHYEDLHQQIPLPFTDPKTTLVVYTPAIKALGELDYFRENQFEIYKRAEVLGAITRAFKALCVAGTHGKTTTSSMLAHLLSDIGEGCTAFLGGIASNFESNLVLHAQSPYAVVEADEFDRSFLQLSPFSAIITAADPDHLDIYGTPEAFKEGFRQFALRIDPNGICLQKEGLNLATLCQSKTYALQSQTADYSAENLRFENGYQLADFRIGKQIWPSVALGLPGSHNVENALGCVALLLELGFNEHEIRAALQRFKGVKRRFEYHVRESNLIYIDDYAHHPQEIEVLLSSVKAMYPTLPVTGIFQPHLFSRTKDFAAKFAAQLSQLDHLILLPIYPARELPIPGVTSDWLCEMSTAPKKEVMQTNDVLAFAKNFKKGVLLTIGAGDIDRLVAPIQQYLSDKS